MQRFEFRGVHGVAEQHGVPADVAAKTQGVKPLASIANLAGSFEEHQDNPAVLPGIITAAAESLGVLEASVVVGKAIVASMTSHGGAVAADVPIDAAAPRAVATDGADQQSQPDEQADEAATKRKRNGTAQPN